MRIIGKGKDYYDYGSMYGIDSTVVYNRRLKEFGEKNMPDVYKELCNFVLCHNSIYIPKNSGERNTYKDKNEATIGTQIVAIGGIVYAFFVTPNYDIDFKEKDRVPGYSLEIKYKDKFKLFKNIEDAKQYVEKNGRYVTDTSWYMSRYQYTHGFKTDFYYEKLKEIGHAVVVFCVEANKYHKFDKNNMIVDEEAVSHIQYNKNNVVADAPILSEIGVSDFIDGNEAFNDIMNFIIDIKQPEMVEISNKEKIVKAGFDNKISFRGVVK